MAFPITDSPILIDPVDFSRGPGSDRSAYGVVSNRFLFPVGAAAYMVANSNSSGLPSEPGRIFKSTDNGTTWARQDQAGEPQVSGNTAVYLAAVESAGILYVYYLTATSFPAVVAFDTGTDTYGSPVVGAIDTDSGARARQFVRLSTGAMYVIFWDQGGGTFLRYMKCSAGAWGAKQTLVSGLTLNNSDIVSATVDSSDRIRVLYVDWTSYTTTGSIFSIDLVADVPGSPSTVDSLDTAGGLNAGNGVIFNSSWIFPIIEPVLGIKPQIAIGTPLNAPVWTIEDVDSGMVAPQVNGLG